MIHVVLGDAPITVDSLPAGHDAALVIRVAASAANRREAGIRVSIADPVLAAAVTRGIAEAIAALPGVPDEPSRVVALRSRKALARLAGQLAGAIAIVRVTERNARHLLELVGGIRAAGALGIQLVWAGDHRDRIERHVFAVLERARATPNEPPIVLATSDRPVTALEILVAHRTRRDER